MPKYLKILMVGFLLLLTGMVGCGVKGDPIPYVDTYAAKNPSPRSPQAEAPKASQKIESAQSEGEKK